MSRIMPGKADCLTVWKNRHKEKHQKRLMLYNVPETFQHFKNDYPDLKIGLTRFRQAKPKFVKAPGSAGSHKVCVCILCENPKLMLNSIKHLEGVKQNCSEIIQEIRCNSNSDTCSSMTCETCLLNLRDLQMKMVEILEVHDIDEIKYEQWLTVDRCELVSITQDAEDFVEKLMKQLEKLIPHKFIATKQSNYSTFLKSSLKRGQFLVQLDFSENNTFKLQNESQSHYWSRSQATLHVCVVYFLGSNDEIEHFSFVVLSDVLKHDSVFVHATIKELINELRSRFQDVDKIFYFSDGAPAHYKNKSTFSLLSYHYRNFGISAEWAYFATAHGKGPCDGLGGTIKRQVFMENMRQESAGQIRNALEMYSFCSNKWENSEITFKLLTKNDIDLGYKEVKSRFEKAKPIVGCRSYHSFVPLTIHSMLIKKFSSSSESRVVKN